MNLEPLKDFAAEHDLGTEPAFSVLDVMAQLGALSQELLKATNYGDGGDADAETMRRKIGDLMFAVAYFSTLYDVDPEAALWESVRRFESKLTGQAEP